MGNFCGCENQENAQETQSVNNKYLYLYQK